MKDASDYASTPGLGMIVSMIGLAGGLATLSSNDTDYDYHPCYSRYPRYRLVELRPYC